MRRKVGKQPEGVVIWCKRKPRRRPSTGAMFRGMAGQVCPRQPARELHYQGKNKPWYCLTPFPCSICSHISFVYIVPFIWFVSFPPAFLWILSCGNLMTFGNLHLNPLLCLCFPNGRRKPMLPGKRSEEKTALNMFSCIVLFWPTLFSWRAHKKLLLEVGRGASWGYSRVGARRCVFTTQRIH